MSTGLPNHAAIDRYPAPAAFAASAAPITTAASARRTSSTTGTNTLLLRMLLAQAVDRDGEATRLQAELDGVI